MPHLPAAAVVIAAVRPRTAAGVEIAGDHDPDRLHPARHVAHGIKAALGDDVVFGMPLFATWLVVSGILDAEELEPLVVLIVATGYRREVISAAAGEARTRRRAVAVAVAAASAPAAPTPRGFAPGVGRLSPACVVATSAPAPPTAAFAVRAAAAWFARFRLTNRLWAAIPCGKGFVVEISARLAACHGVAALLARPFASHSPAAPATAAAPTSSSTRAALFIERSLGRLTCDCRPLVDEIVERFGVDVGVVKWTFVVEARRSRRPLALAAATAAATATPSATSAPGAALAVGLRAVTTRLTAFAAATGVGRIAAVAALCVRRSFGAVRALEAPGLLIEGHLAPGGRGGAVNRARFPLGRSFRSGARLRRAALGRPRRLAGRGKAEARVEIIPALRGTRRGRPRRCRTRLFHRSLRRLRG